MTDLINSFLMVVNEKFVLVLLRIFSENFSYTNHSKCNYESVRSEFSSCTVYKEHCVIRAWHDFYLIIKCLFFKKKNQQVDTIVLAVLFCSQPVVVVSAE